MKNSSAWAGAGIAVLLLTGVRAEAGAAPAPEPLPTDGTTFNAWVADQQTYDDNLYRIPPSTVITSLVAPGAKREDYYNTLSLGAEGQLQAGRQLFQANARVDEIKFVHNTSLDDTTYDLNGVWDWNIGSALGGNAGGDLNRSLASFSEVRIYGKDLVKSTSSYVNGHYQFGPHWALLAEFSETTASHGLSLLDYNNYRGTTYTGGVEYATEVDDTFSLKYHYYQGRYPDNAPTAGGEVFNSNYNENFPQFWMKYGLTDKTTLNGNVGHLKRQYIDAATGEYTGIIWRVWVDWNATDKISLTARTWHEIHAYTVSAADYFISTGESIAPLWQATEKFNISLLASYEKQNYIANSTSAQVFGARQDKINAEQLNFSYNPRDRLNLTLFVKHENRHSSLQSQPGIYPFTYDDELASLSATYKFF